MNTQTNLRNIILLFAAGLVLFNGRNLDGW
jgi:hypothetical protein